MQQVGRRQKADKRQEGGMGEEVGGRRQEAGGGACECCCGSTRDECLPSQRALFFARVVTLQSRN